MSQSDDKARYQKMEKAEILEMAVSYMKNLRNNDNAGSSSSSNKNEMNNLQYYSMAYRQCLSEFQNFLGGVQGINDEFKSNIMNHMSQRYMDMLSYASSNPSQNNNNQMEEQTSTNGKIKSNLNKSNRFSPYNSSSKLSPAKSSKLSKQQANNQNDENEQRLNMMSIMTNEQNLSTLSSSSAASPTQNYLQNQTSKFGGSCSSLDSYGGNQRATSPCSSSNSSSNDHNESQSRLGLSFNAHNSSTTSSPALSVCSSPVNNNLNNSIASAAVKNFCLGPNALAMMDEQAALNFATFYQNCLMKVWRPW